MKTIAIIPTHNRNTAGNIARALEEVVDKIIILSQGSTIEGTIPKMCTVIERPSDGLCPNRNAGVKYAIKGNYDVMLQIDDDLKFKSQTIKEMMKILKKEEKIAAVSSDAEMLAYWSRGLLTNRPYKLTPVASQLFAVRVNILMDLIEKFKAPVFEYGTMEDIRMSMKLWTMGYPVVRLHGNENLCHKPFITRTSKSDDQGGQTIQDRNRLLPEALKRLLEFTGIDGVLKRANLVEKADGQLSYRLWYNYENMIANSVLRNGFIGYRDNHGHAF